MLCSSTDGIGINRGDSAFLRPPAPSFCGGQLGVPKPVLHQVQRNAGGDAGHAEAVAAVQPACGHDGMHGALAGHAAPGRRGGRPGPLPRRRRIIPLVWARVNKPSGDAPLIILATSAFVEMGTSTTRLKMMMDPEMNAGLTSRHSFAIATCDHVRSGSKVVIFAAMPAVSAPRSFW